MAWATVVLGASSPLAKAAGEEEEPPKFEDVTVLPPFVVKGEQVEDFGFRFSVTVRIPGTDTVVVSQVFPNTAASRAGLKPGDIIWRVDGKRVSALSLGLNPAKLQERKWKELQSGKKSVSLVLELREPGAKSGRTVTLAIPSPAPRWGGPKWARPEGRPPASVKETGPLANLARDVLDHGIWSGTDRHRGYEWRIVQARSGHRIWVTQQNGRTEVLLEHRSAEVGECSFGTSPSGALESARCEPPKKTRKGQPYTPDEVRSLFQAEIDFWLTQVGRVTGRWPFEALSGKSDVVASLDRVPRDKPRAVAPPTEAVRKRVPATEEQRQLFADAVGKLGMDEDAFAFTETVRSSADDRVTTMRFDPSKPPAERCTLLKVDGKNPKPAFVKQWRAEGRAAVVGLSDLPPLASLVDLDDVRVFAEETTAVVFELPVQAPTGEISAEHFQALFRVNRTTRGFEDFSIRLREAVKVNAAAKVTDAGVEVRFVTVDPAFAPQPAYIKMGGGLRVLLVKVSRTFEATRKDFQRVNADAQTQTLPLEP